MQIFSKLCIGAIIDDMYFKIELAAEYDEKKSKAPQLIQLSLIVTNQK
jgi:hypothetical protein